MSVLHIFIIAYSLVIEWANGGIPTKKGIYVPWDIHLGLFFLGFLFLFLYYKRYHIVKSLELSATFKERLKLFRILIFKETKEVMRAIPNTLLLDEPMNESFPHNSKGIGQLTYKSQTSIVVHFKLEEVENITYIDEDSSKVEIKTPLKKPYMNSTLTPPSDEYNNISLFTL